VAVLIHIACHLRGLSTEVSEESAEDASQ
jgi:hypothetical protein